METAIEMVKLLAKNALGAFTTQFLYSKIVIDGYNEPINIRWRSFMPWKKVNPKMKRINRMIGLSEEENQRLDKFSEKIRSQTLRDCLDFAILFQDTKDFRIFFLGE